MPERVSFALLLVFVLLTSVSAGGLDRTVKAFPISGSGLSLTRLAQPTQYFDKIGRCAGLMGVESGQFEAWVWPWKPLRNFDLKFYLGSSTQPILPRDVVRSVTVTPEMTTLTYVHESFTIHEQIIVPRAEPGIIVLLDVRTTQPLSIVPGFIPVMQPMWPAGIGGQFSYWDDDVHAYVISEGQWRAAFLCGSPAGEQMTAPPAHMFADNPIEFRINVKPGDDEGKFIPIVIAGARPDSASGKMKLDSVKATYARLASHPERYYNECRDYYRELRTSTVQVQTGDSIIDQGLEWGKVALDNLLIDNPKLGHGMVAGFGFSGGGERPGFAWFFGGDAFINVLAMNSLGMFRQSRDALLFTQKWQRQENFPVRKKNPSDPPTDVGKMAHELSQSDGIVDWWNEYHFGYNHADTTPWYIVAMGDYVRTSGDTAFLRSSWASVRRAYDWCLSKDTDGDGLMDLKGAGLGALEFGKLVGIYADVYTCGVWVQGIKEMEAMARTLGDSSMAREASAQFAKAQPRLERLFWLDKERFYSYGATERGDQVREKTPWAGVAMMFGLLDEEHTRQSIEAMNGLDVCSDWGVRSLSNTSDLFDPANYNYGAVWPFISSFFVTAQLRHGYDAAGYDMLRATLGHAFDHAVGEVPEVFSGQFNEKLAEGYHHQGFSTTGYLLPLMRGLFGMEVDALHHSVAVRPTDRWGRGARMKIGHIICGQDTLSILRSAGTLEHGWWAVTDVTHRGSHPVAVTSAYSRALLGKKEAPADLPASIVATLNGKPTECSVETRRGDLVSFSLTSAVADTTSMIFAAPNSIDISVSGFGMPPAIGEPNRGPRILSQVFEKNILTTELEGLPGDSCSLGLYLLQSPDVIESIKGGTLDGDRIKVQFGHPIWPGSDVVQKKISILFKPKE